MTELSASTIDERVNRDLALRLGSEDGVVRAAAEIELLRMGDIELVRVALISWKVLTPEEAAEADNPKLRNIRSIVSICTAAIFASLFVGPWLNKILIFIIAIGWSRQILRTPILKATRNKNKLQTEAVHRGFARMMELLQAVKDPNCLPLLLGHFFPVAARPVEQYAPVAGPLKGVLISVLKNSTGTSFAAMEEQDRSRAFIFLDIYQSLVFPEAVMEVLRLVEESVDVTAIDSVLELAKGAAAHRDSKAVKLRAVEVYQVLIARQSKLNVGKTLLRPAYAPDDSESLLRPAGTGMDAEQELLRPSDVDHF